MNITIGNKIKKLRKAKGITQETLAKNIGISFQAVSKWENNIAFPDIMLIPILANYFGVSIDELFDYNLKEIKTKITAICDKAYQYRQSDPQKAKAILEDGLKNYPNNDILLNNLLYVLNYSEDPDTTIHIASKLIEETDDAEVKYDALRFLAYAFEAKGEYQNAKHAIEQIPEIYFSKLSEAAFILHGEEKFDAAKKAKWISLEMLLQMCQKLSECYEEKNELHKSITEAEYALDILSAIKDDRIRENYNDYSSFFLKSIQRLNTANN